MARPKKDITPEVIKKAESLSAQGLTMSQIANVLGIGESTLYEKQAKYPEFSEAIKRGRDKGVETITNALFQKAKDGDNTAMIFYLKNRAGWKDKVETEHTGDGLKVDVKIGDRFQDLLKVLDELAYNKQESDNTTIQ
jgi:transposase